MSKTSLVLALAATLGVAAGAAAANDPGPARDLVKVRVDRSDSFPADGIIDRITTTTFTYDGHGRLLSEQAEIDRGADGTVDAVGTTTYAYDSAGRLILKVGGETESWTYDARGRLVEHVLTADDGAYEDRETFVRDRRGRALTREHRVLEYEMLTESMDTYAAWDARDNPVAWATLTHESFSDGMGGWIPTGDWSASSTAAYSNRGLQELERTERDDGDDGSVDSVTTTAWAYDAQGRILSRVTERDDAADGTANFRSTRTWPRDDRGRQVGLTDFTDVNASGVNDAGDFGLDEVIENDQYGRPVSATLAPWRNRGSGPEVTFTTETTWSY